MKLNRRLLTLDDALLLHLLITESKQRLQRYFPLTLKENATVDLTRTYLQHVNEHQEENQGYLFGIFDKDYLIGFIDVKNISARVAKCELGYFIREQYGGQRIMTNEIKAVLGFCFSSLQMNKVYLRIGPDNIGSKKLAANCGFQLEGVLRQEFRIETDELIDVEYYGLFAKDYKH